MKGDPLPTVQIHYRRLPDDLRIYHQLLLDDDGELKVSFAPEMDLDDPRTVGGETILEPGSDVVWFTFPGAWHDIGLFHDAQGVFTGVYANILTPPTFHPGPIWRTTDLFLDVWLPKGARELKVLDEDAFAEAVEEGWVDGWTRSRALDQVESILDQWVRGLWPPSRIFDWTRERARSAAGGQRPRGTREPRS
jgi:predicted RNA-binding protein associated with RNAse of E/G family